MFKILLRLLVNGAAIWVAAALVPGVAFDTSNAGAVIAVTVVFSLLNAFLAPVLKFFGFPLIVVTLGFFALLINAAMLYFAATLTTGLTVSGFWAAVLGSLVISVVSWFFGLFLSGDKDDDS